MARLVVDGRGLCAAVATEPKWEGGWRSCEGGRSQHDGLMMLAVEGEGGDDVRDSAATSSFYLAVSGGCWSL